MPFDRYGHFHDLRFNFQRENFRPLEASGRFDNSQPLFDAKIRDRRTVLERNQVFLPEPIKLEPLNNFGLGSSAKKKCTCLLGCCTCNSLF